MPVDLRATTVEALTDCNTIASLLPTDSQSTNIAETNWTPPDDAKEKAQQAFSTAQDTAQNALYTGGKYMRENKIPVILARSSFFQVELLANHITETSAILGS